MLDKNNKGVVVVAAGHPYYGRMAFNLAKTIKAVDSTCPIQLIVQGNALNHINNKELFVFDYITRVDGYNGFELKLYVNELSKFDSSLLLDADCIWVNKKSPLQLINELNEKCIFTGITEGYHDYTDPDKSDPSNRYYFWADLSEMQQQYQLKDKIYQWRTEFIYFNKCQYVDNLFASAKSVYENARTQLASLKLFAGNVPDELAINIAACIHNIHPHQYKWCPSFWHRLTYENVPPIEQVSDQYYILSCGSNINTGNVKRVYDMFVKSASYKLGLQHMFQLISKREMMPDRQKM
jgi:hypothetical protein